MNNKQKDIFFQIHQNIPREGPDDSESLKIIQNSGYKIINYFVLPKSAWWNHYYQPLEEKLQGLRKRYQDDTEALEVINMEQSEIDLYRKYSEYYSYVFYIVQKL
ncbi:hypothetical protein [Nodularia sp. UHCC 0506]|uniref:hypothetical protein n=1 Tax=Nodularia sp. UHCC 0506 TaxID=3110243 RepID=UPI002B215E16|nr:hypothetical protein [Nodularia sp. UHCC 0506]MEA5512821.1 hypothetical protein [Nodularia sp. UHCC 0506]